MTDYCRHCTQVTREYRYPSTIYSRESSLSHSAAKAPGCPWCRRDWPAPGRLAYDHESIGDSEPRLPPMPTTGGSAVWIATGGGLGWLRQCPGTWGSLWGIPLAWAYQLLRKSGCKPARSWHSRLWAFLFAAARHSEVRRSPRSRLCRVLTRFVGMAATLFMFDATRRGHDRVRVFAVSGVRRLQTVARPRSRSDCRTAGE